MLDSMTAPRKDAAPSSGRGLTIRRLMRALYASQAPPPSTRSANRTQSSGRRTASRHRHASGMTTPRKDAAPSSGRGLTIRRLMLALYASQAAPPSTRSANLTQSSGRRTARRWRGGPRAAIRAGGSIGGDRVSFHSAALYSRDSSCVTAYPLAASKAFRSPCSAEPYSARTPAKTYQKNDSQKVFS